MTVATLPAATAPAAEWPMPAAWIHLRTAPRRPAASVRESLRAAASLASAQRTRGQAIRAALTFLARFPDAERLWENAECPHGSASLALVLQLRCSSAAQVAQSAQAAAGTAIL